MLSSAFLPGGQLLHSRRRVLGKLFSKVVECEELKTTPLGLNHVGTPQMLNQVYR